MSRPMQAPIPADGLRELHDFVAQHPRLFVLSGAGVSTGSGIPGYRDEEGRWTRKPPVTAAGLPANGIRAKALLGAEHDRLADRRRRPAERGPRCAGPSRRGGPAPPAGDAERRRPAPAGRQRERPRAPRDASVASCASIAVRSSRGRRCNGCCEEANPEFAHAPATAAPDGDADLELRALDGFVVPACPSCGGVLKPDVVFFGDNVPRERVTAALAALDESDAMLVVGSSLMVYSGYRFCEHAERRGRPIAAINLGRTRADHLFALKVQRAVRGRARRSHRAAGCGAAVSFATGLLSPSRRPSARGRG